jgi:hypothetical protein
MPGSYPVPPQFPKKCTTCTRIYDSASWTAIALLGYQTDDFEKMEMRNCACGTTLVVIVERYQAEGVAS